MSRPKMFAVAACAGIGLPAAGTSAQVTLPVRYELNPRSTYLQERCLPPCLCPYNGVEAPLEGTVLLSRVGQDPFFTHYRVSEIEWVAPTPLTPTRITGVGRYRIGGEFARHHEMKLDLEIGGEPVHVESGIVSPAPGVFPDIIITMTSEQIRCDKWTIRLNASVDERDCYADCDHSTGRGVLDIFDFLCFQNAFAAGRPYACDCDETPPETCDVFDFLCFQNQYSEGCQP